jgi:hypothetical protein
LLSAAPTCKGTCISATAAEGWEQCSTYYAGSRRKAGCLEKRKELDKPSKQGDREHRWSTGAADGADSYTVL